MEDASTMHHPLIIIVQGESITRTKLLCPRKASYVRTTAAALRMQNEFTGILLASPSRFVPHFRWRTLRQAYPHYAFADVDVGTAATW